MAIVAMEHVRARTRNNMIHITFTLPPEVPDTLHAIPVRGDGIERVLQIKNHQSKCLRELDGSEWSIPAAIVRGAKIQEYCFYAGDINDDNPSIEGFDESYFFKVLLGEAKVEYIIKFRQFKGYDMKLCRLSVKANQMIEEGVLFGEYQFGGSIFKVALPNSLQIGKNDYASFYLPRGCEFKLIAWSEEKIFISRVRFFLPNFIIKLIDKKDKR